MKSWWAQRGAVGVCAWVLTACSQDRPAPSSETETNEPSPNAQILPAPLHGASGRASSRPGTSAAAPSVRPPEATVVRPLPVEAEVPPDEGMNATVASAPWELVFAFQFPELRASPDEAVEARAFAHWIVQLLPGTAELRARQTVRLSGALFHLPEGTELRSRADRIGSIVVWPDRRSYRTVPRGALAALFQERRVDVMPELPSEVSAVEHVERAGQILSRRRVKSERGELSLLFSPQAELGDATLLFCDLLFEFLRVRRAPEMCERGELPIEARYAWAGGGEMRLSLLSQKRMREGEHEGFRLPPSMPIFKRGELPPDEARPWSNEELGRISAASGSASITFKNVLDVPLWILVEGVPFVRVDPNQVWQWAPGRSVRTSARDFFGEIVRGSLTVQAPASVHWGAEPELQPPPEGFPAQPPPL